MNNKPSIYISSSREEVLRTQLWMAKCVENGLVISYDWTREITPFDSDTPDDVAFNISKTELRAIEHSDYFWLLVPETGGTGCWVEFGFAMGAQLIDRHPRRDGIRSDGPLPVTIASGSAWRRSIFTSVATHTPTDEEAFERFCHMKRTRP